MKNNSADSNIIMSENSLKAAAMLFTAGTVLVSANNGSGSSSVSCSHEAANGYVVEWQCKTFLIGPNESCCYEETGNAQSGKVEGFCCGFDADDGDCNWWWSGCNEVREHSW